MSNDITPTSLSAASPALEAISAAPHGGVVKKQVLPANEQAAQTQPDPRETRRILEEATKHLNEQMNRNSRDLSFSVDSEAHKIILTVKNRDTGEVVRQIPSEVALRVTHDLDNLKGLLEDKTS